MIDKSRALTLLGSGLGPTTVADTLGCDQSYISQLMMDETFRSQVLALRIEHLQSARSRDLKIDEIEDELIKKLQEGIKYMTSTKDVLRAFAMVNAAKRRGSSMPQGDINIQNIVNINLPQVARERYITNKNGEVVQVGEKATVTMPLQQLLKDRLKQNAQVEDVKPDDGRNSENAFLASLGAPA